MAELTRHVPASGELYGSGELHQQHLRNEASSIVGDVHEKQRPNMAGGNEGVPAGGELHR